MRVLFTSQNATSAVCSGYVSQSAVLYIAERAPKPTMAYRFFSMRLIPSLRTDRLQCVRNGRSHLRCHVSRITQVGNIRLPRAAIMLADYLLKQVRIAHRQ